MTRNLGTERSSHPRSFSNNSSLSIIEYSLYEENAQVRRDCRFYLENTRFKSVPDLIRDLEFN